MWNRKKTESHIKSMDSYTLFAWRDAVSIASLLAENFKVTSARKYYQSLQLKEIIEFEMENSRLIGDFIQKSETQRPNFLKKISKDVDDECLVLFLVLAIIGVIRAKDAIELRDRFRHVMAAGRGNRITVAAFYDFSREIRLTHNYDWPEDVFDTMKQENRCFE